MIDIGHGWAFSLHSIRHVAYGPRDAFDAVPQWTQDLHLVHTIAGAGWLNIGSVRVEARPGVVVVPPPFVRCRWEKLAGVGWEMVNLHVGITSPAGVPLHERDLLPIAFPLPDGGPRELTDLYHRWNADSELLRLEAAAEAVALAVRHVRSAGQVDAAVRRNDPEMIRARRIVEAHADRFITASALAAKAGLGPREFDRRFRACWGVTPKSYWQSCRFGLAQSRLISTSAHVGRIAEELGFTDVYYFSRWFRSRAGLSPSEFRRRSRAM
ncbi:helix-turn-helix domain-containing protein [Roseitranquillus sediminis]|uniref:helix-turn-helix domain-containing protein n=1 Tax=Roseitranquillus sediminis TaxID=2809051 RepID=UPI001D0C1205|nr:AraC family transcriptional regulator [Roseitranquillus sediminis]MBM9595450.1 helix-turn-helix transcriptional regulator [Roseitranquillus sediminis]